MNVLFMYSVWQMKRWPVLQATVASSSTCTRVVSGQGISQDMLVQWTQLALKFECSTISAAGASLQHLFSLVYTYISVELKLEIGLSGSVFKNSLC